MANHSTPTNHKFFITRPANAALSVAAAALIAFTAACTSSRSSHTVPAATMQPGSQLQPVAYTLPPAHIESRTAGVETKPVMKMKQRDALNTFHDANFGLSLQYPWQYGFHAGHKLRAQSETVISGFVPPANAKASPNAKSGAISLGAIDVPAGYYTSTDFKRAFLTMNVNRKLTSDECGQFADVHTSDADRDDSGDASAGSATQPQPQKVEVGGDPYLLMTRRTDDSELRFYHTYQGGQCYEFVLGLITSDDDDGSAAGDSNANPTTLAKKEVKPVPADRVFARLEAMLATVSIDVNDQPQTTAAVPPQPPRN